MPVDVKICGIRSADIMKVAINAGAAFVGLVFFEASPRSVTPELAADLVRLVPPGVKAVGVFVDPDNEYLEHVLSEVPLDIIQLHGKETPARIQDIRQSYNLPIMKAISVAEKEDLAQAGLYKHAANWFLFDAKPPKNVVAALPGGLGIPFDWTILRDTQFSLPWMLSGGLTPDNLSEAVEISRARFVDVSSGVEDSPGKKNPEKILRFLEAAQRL